ncbi:hypothetical protein FRC17_000407, partial [Serendipita sp. 399]
SKLRPRNKVLAENLQKKWSGLRRFPDEVFSIIFELYVEDSENPWTLMHVCSQWRTAALHTRRIWSKIMLTHAPHVDGSSRRHLGSEVCHTETLLRNALARAAGGPLDIRLFVGHHNGLLSRPFYSDISCKLIDPLRADKAYLRIRRLEATLTDFKWLRHLTFDGFEFPSLESAVLHTVPCDLNERVLKTASRLRSLRLNQNVLCPVDWDLSKLKYLTDFRLDMGWMSFGDGGFKTISSIPNLVNLYLSAARINRCKTLSIPTLKNLTLDCSHIIDDLELPQLQNLIMHNSSISATAGHPLALPSLTMLGINSCGMGDHFYIVPALQTLSISQDFGGGLRQFEQFMENVIKPEYISPRILRLHGINVASKLLVQFLAKLPQLEELEIGGEIQLSKPFFEALSGCRFHSTGTSEHEEPLCTQLKTLRISFNGISNETTYFDMLKWSHVAVRARAKGEYPFEQVFIKDRYSNRWNTTS